MHKVFISHAEEDADFALRLARSLEYAGFSCWYYERDTLPGRSYLVQITEAIQNSAAVLLLISAQSVTSHQIRKEIARAHELDRCFLPILINVSQNQFQQLQPEWAAALGTTAAIEMRYADFDSVFDRLVKGLEALTIERDLEARVVPHGDEANPRGAKGDGKPPFKNRWASDANQIDIKLLSEVIFKTDIVDDFLHGERYFVSANKGLGKTLLLTYKRSLLNKQYTQNRQSGTSPSVHFVPEDRPYLDLMSDLRSLSNDHKEFLSNLSHCKRLWSMALKVSALSHFSGILTDNDEGELVRMPNTIRRWLFGSKVEPSVVFKELLSNTVKQINQLVDKYENFIEYKVREVKSGIYIFIDKVDQAIRELPRQAWINVQAGLVEAAWDVMNSNSHIKVFVTIREEAFSNYESDIKGNLYGSTTILRYNEAELSELLDKLTECYEEHSTFKDFTGLNVIRNTNSDLPEDSFQYLYRHTVGRPRDLVIICNELSTRAKQLTEGNYKHIVNNISSDMLISNIFDEMKVFLDSLQHKSERQRLFALLPYNIMSEDELIEICCAFNHIDRGCYDTLADIQQIHHPFCELYYCGLLGTLTRETLQGGMRQKFKQPHDLINEFHAQIPESDLYFLHPALHSLIAKFRGQKSYRVFKYIIVGHNYHWLPHYGHLINIQKHLFQIENAEHATTLDETLREINSALSDTSEPTSKTMERRSRILKELHALLLTLDNSELTQAVAKLTAMLPK